MVTWCKGRRGALPPRGRDARRLPGRSSMWEKPGRPVVAAASLPGHSLAGEQSSASERDSSGCWGGYGRTAVAGRAARVDRRGSPGRGSRQHHQKARPSDRDSRPAGEPTGPPPALFAAARRRPREPGRAPPAWRGTLRSKAISIRRARPCNRHAGAGLRDPIRRRRHPRSSDR